mmetsp:Transcript_19346/g.41141  ORF Transcript_19346/g.41141 Transcript_19346/m.41141 type:complete len:117 (-) Transcript_19346:573-923(-)
MARCTMAMSVKIIAKTPMAELGASADNSLRRQSGRVGNTLNMMQHCVRDMLIPTVENASSNISAKKHANATLSPKQAIALAMTGTHAVRGPMTIAHWRSSCNEPVISQLRDVIHIV